MTAARTPKRTILPVACAVLLATSGCSMMFMEKAPATVDPRRAPHCTPNNATVILDAALGATYLLGAFAGANDGENEDRSGLIGAGLFGALFAASALIYSGEADKCNRAIDDHNHWIITGDAQ